MALEPVISDEYRASFFDDNSYSPPTLQMLQGLAAVIEDETQEWRPTVTELIDLIPHDEAGERLIKAGYAYGAGKQLRSNYPGPSILMFCSALNNVGSAPQTELRDTVDRAAAVIAEAGLAEDESVKALIVAARERASFDKVSQMLRAEFREGLNRAGRHSEDQIEGIARDIVNIGHAARHEALIDIQEYATIPVSDFMIVDVRRIPENQGFWDSFLLRMEDDQTFMGTERLGSLAAQAQVGCAQALLSRLESLR